MTKQEFFETLKQTDRRWIVLPDGTIRARRLRRGGSRDCPVTAVARLVCKKIFPINRYFEAADALKLSNIFANNIASAADIALGNTVSVNTATRRHRKQLFQILHLPKEKL